MTLRNIALAWAASFMFAVWSGFCVLIGVAWAFAAIIAALEHNGIHVADDLARMVGL